MFEGKDLELIPVTVTLEALSSLSFLRCSRMHLLSALGRDLCEILFADSLCNNPWRSYRYIVLASERAKNWTQQFDSTLFYFVWVVTSWFPNLKSRFAGWHGLQGKPAVRTPTQQLTVDTQRYMALISLRNWNSPWLSVLSQTNNSNFLYWSGQDFLISESEAIHTLSPRKTSQSEVLVLLCFTNVNYFSGYFWRVKLQVINRKI